MGKGFTRIVVLLALAVTMLAATGSAYGAQPVSGMLSDPKAQVRWDGGGFQSLAPDVYQGVVPEACAVTACDEFGLTLALPPTAWTSPDDGLQVGIRWINEEEGEFDLYVYGPDGNLAAQSDGIIASSAESVLIKHAQNGTYRVVVVLTFWDDGCQNTPCSPPKQPTYDGVAEVERAPAVSPVRDLLPNLIPLPTEAVRLAIGTYYGDAENITDAASPGLYTDNVPSCYPEEMAPVDITTAEPGQEGLTQQEGARKCLRFDQIIGNIGEGPVELRYRMEGTGTDQRVHQRIYRSDRSYHDEIRDSYVFHPTHAHFHYKNMAQSTLWPADANGQKIGNGPLRISKHSSCPADAPADDPCRPRGGRKNSFCLADIKNIWFARKGDAARRFSFKESCDVPEEKGTSGNYLINGISVGWADRYPWNLASGFAEVSGIANGYYVLETVVDPNNTIPEIKENDNTNRTLIWLCDDETGVASQQPKPC